MRLIFNGQEYFGPRGPAGPDGNPIGSIISYLGRTPPRDYLACDGGEYRISDYPELAAFFQQQFGSANHFGGDGEANFAVPDMRNLFLRGYHGEAEETLSGEVGQRQEGTEIPMILNWGNMLGGGSIAVPASGETVLPLHEDRTVGQTTQAAFAAALGTNVTGAAGDLSFLYTARPVNAAVLYCIKAAESIPAQDIYSTEERRIGTWVDGKPVYQKVISGIVSSGLVLLTSISQVISIEGILYGGNLVDHYPVFYYVDASNMLVYSLNNGNLTMHSSANNVGTKFNIIIEYTKTTDEATISVPNSALAAGMPALDTMPETGRQLRNEEV